MGLSFHERYRLAKAKALGRPEKKAAVPKKKKAKPERSIEKQAKDILQSRRVQSNARPRDKIFKTRELNLSEMVQVRVNNKTVVYVKPGTDIEAIKAKYNRKPAAKPKDDDFPPTYQF